MLIIDTENLYQFYQLRHMTEPCIVKYMAFSLQTQQSAHYPKGSDFASFPLQFSFNDVLKMFVYSYKQIFFFIRQHGIIKNEDKEIKDPLPEPCKIHTESTPAGR